MADYTAVILLGTGAVMTYLTLHKQHPFIAGILYILEGTASWLILPLNNPYGLILIAIGFITIFTSPYEKRGQ